MATNVFSERMFWSRVMNGDLSPTQIIKQLVDAGFKVIKENVPSPVGKVPKGSTVITDHNDKRAYWIDGKLYQRPTK